MSNHEKIDVDFLYIMLQKEGLYKIADTSTIPQINNKHIEPYKIYLPKMEEQHKIGTYFSNLDHLITLHQRKCEETKSLKKYMLQKMFPENGKCVPEIRFSGFSDDWEQRKLSEIAIEKLSNGIMNNQANDETGLRHINVINMYDPDKIHPEKLTFSNYDEDAVKKCNVEWGDIFLTRSSLKPEGIAESNVLLDSGRFVYDDHLIRLKLDKEKYDPFFVKLNLSGSIFKRQFIARAKTTAFTTIGQEDIAECFGLFPEKEEQEKIGTYFSNLDHLITLHQRKCEQTKNLKKYMLQKMFPQNGAKVPEIRFDGFTYDWEQRKLGEVCSRVQGNDGRMDLPTLTISAANGWMNQEDRFSGNIAGKEQENYTLLHKGELSYNHGNSKLAKYGTVFSLQSYKEALVPRVYHSFKVEEGSPDFLEYYFATKLPDRELGKLISSGARMDGLLNIGYNEFMGIQMLFPSVEEQKQISNYFRNLDHLITLHQRKCEQTKEK